MARTMEEIAALLAQVKFKHRLLGGVDEKDVWRTLEALQTEYQALAQADRKHYAQQLQQREQRILELDRRAQRLARRVEEAEAAARQAQETAQDSDGDEGGGPAAPAR